MTVTSADHELKAKHRAMWASGDYPALAAELIASLGQVLVDAVGVAPGDHVLDIAAGSGNAAIPAAIAGARVTASDLTPELFDAGREEAARRGVGIDWVPADAEALPFGDSSFDTVLSCVGVMFAPHHDRCANEMLRVCRPGGRLGLISWTPQGFIGQLFTTMKPFMAPPPPGAEPPPLWGDESHVSDLFGADVRDVTMQRQSIRIDRFGSATQFRDYFKQRYGPTIAAYARQAGDQSQIAELDAAMVDLWCRNDGDASSARDWEYLLFTGRRSGDPVGPPEIVR